MFYCRTYDFSTMGVAPGGSLESVRFTVPNVPHGSYDLCVVANGISSHCVDFPHHRRKRHKHEEGEECGCRRACCERCCEPCCCREDDVYDAEFRELKDEISRLQNSMHRLSSMLPKRKMSKEVTKGGNTEKDDRDDDDESAVGRKSQEGDDLRIF
jgi:hypothetical protein